jgi:pimeloyl-ACP methyl ester carboxylesterase
VPVTNPAAVPTVNRRALLQAAAGLVLCAVGYFLAHRESYEVRTVLANAGGCNMPTDIYEARSGTPLGSVVLLHGLSANKKVMSFNAQEFANQDLRVFVPDLPGHGKTRGPFSPARAEYCAESLVRDLAARKAIIPERTVLVGHSMGGAVAVRLAARIPVAGVIAISPAPMHPAPGFAPEVLLFPTPPPLAAHSLILSAEWEPAAVKQIARDLVTQSADSSSKYQVILATSHVSILFAAATFESLRSWDSQILGTSSTASLPMNLPVLGCILGVIGLSILAPPFLREMTASHSTLIQADSNPPPPHSFLRSTLALAACSSLAVILLRFVVPFNFVHIFQGGYLASLLFLIGVATLLIQSKSFPALNSFFTANTLASSAAAILLILLFAAWFELTFYEAWLTPARWLRFPLLILLFLPWHLAEEVFLGDPTAVSRLRRMFQFFLFRGLVWLFLVASILYLHSAQFAFVLLVVYFVVFSLLQRLASDLIRVQTRSIPASALFGAILLADFVLAILPVA